jgi:hypothetical protein
LTQWSNDFSKRNSKFDLYSPWNTQTKWECFIFPTPHLIIDLFVIFKLLFNLKLHRIKKTIMKWKKIIMKGNTWLVI